MTEPVIIEVALNGITSRAHNQRVPVHPDELARDAIDCIDAGATIVHTHAHLDPGLFHLPDEIVLVPAKPPFIGTDIRMAQKSP